MTLRIKPLTGFGIVSRTELLASGMTRATLRDFVDSGVLQRLDRSRFAIPDAEPGIVRAVSEGGTLTCMSSLDRKGISILDGTLLHIRRPPCRRRGRTWAVGVTECVVPPVSSFESGNTEGPIWPDHPLDGIDAALLVAFTNHTDEEMIVVLDSLLHTRTRTRAELHTLLLKHSIRARRLVSLANSSSESALESVVRHRLQSRGFTLRTQVSIKDLGRVDMLLGRSLVIETDGFAFHADRDSFAEDRRRDRTAVALGYTVIRLTWEQVFGGWQSALTDILAITSTGRHLKLPGQPRAARPPLRVLAAAS